MLASARAHCLLCLALLTLGFSLASASPPADQLVVHEWGTFTALQDENGQALPGINVDDEPLPAFCHNLNRYIVDRPNAVPAVMMKGAPERHPYVTLRLETPVLYFHPAPSEKLPFKVDVDVQFHGGWLTEFYPKARPDAPGMTENSFHFGAITASTVGSLAWHDVEVGAEGTLPETERHVWLPPRAVNAAMVSVRPHTREDPDVENEKFLFYRGVGNRPVPLAVNMDEASHRLAIHSQSADVLALGQTAKIDGLWLVHIRRDGSVAWRAIDPVTISNDRLATLATASSSFADADYAPANLDTVRAAMHRAIVGQGLFDDEATAMLETWKHAYFQSPGLRLFFLLPRTWTDAVLPLKLSRPAQIQRIMMGRLELISPEQRELLKKLAKMNLSGPDWVRQIRPSPASDKFFQGRSDFGDLGVAIPADYQAYLDLGRFRNALVLAEARARPTVELTAFVNAYGLRAFTPE